MKKRIITGTIIIFILMLLFSFCINASIFATIGMKGLSFANPESAQLIKTIVCVEDPLSCIGGYLTQQTSEKTLDKIAQQSPEVAKAVEQYNYVKEWIDEGAQITEDLKLTEDGQLAGGSITISEKQNLEKITNNVISDAEHTEVSAKGENEPYNIKAVKDGASVTIGKKIYSNLQKGSTITADREGKIKEADITAKEKTIYEIEGVHYEVPQGGRIVYKDGKAEIFAKEGETVKINQQEIKLNSGNVQYDGETITGKDFTIDNTRFMNTEYGKVSKITLDEEGYILGRNTIAENNQMVITSKEENLLLSKSCGNVAGFNNYVNPCKGTLIMEGEGFSVQLKEGKEFGLEIKQGDVLNYDLEGGKVLLSRGEQTIYTKEGRHVMVTNGGIITKYTTINGGSYALLNSGSLGNNPDVGIITRFDDLTTFEDSETGLETMFSCPATTGLTYAIIDTTGAVERLPETITSQQLPPANCKLTIKVLPTDDELRSIIKKYSSLQRFFFKKYPQEKQMKLIKSQVPTLDDKTIERALEILNTEF